MEQIYGVLRDEHGATDIKMYARFNDLPAFTRLKFIEVWLSALAAQYQAVLDEISPGFAAERQEWTERAHAVQPTLLNELAGKTIQSAQALPDGGVALTFTDGTIRHVVGQAPDQQLFLMPVSQ